MISFAVAQRRHEIGIRLALGAARRKVIGMVMREVQTLLVIGGAIGAALPLLAGPSAASLMFGLEPDDPTTLLSAFLLLAAIAAVASFVPARAAARVDPLSALRQE
jgi:putative ABC transport system permease protein